MRLIQLVREVAQSGMEFVYPRSCHWCSELLPRDPGESLRFCTRCLKELAPVIPDRCQICSAPVGPNLNTEQGCIHCKRERMKYHSVISLGPYQGDLRVACLKCKQPGTSSLTSALTELTFERNLESLRNLKAEIVIPVPHFWLQRLSSDHPAMSMAECLGRKLKIPVDRLTLRKVRSTDKQQTLSASARKGNLNRAFRVSGKSRIQGRRVLLVDDILTTGITADRCTRELLGSGASQVDVVVLARSLGG
ncbi:ComF family protein [Planctomicrobium sp. SH661]|uniref:ComF family protein n=1 Tax=Planctomicrobium sp. SH661 TaxID=3448124 RepID=UPI003F5C6D38